MTDLSEHHNLFAAACGYKPDRRHPQPTKEECARLDDNFVQSSNGDCAELIGYGLGATKGRSIHQRGNIMPKGEVPEKMEIFGKRCADQLGPRFYIEHVSYNGRAPKILGRWSFDLADKAGSALASPPAVLFEGVFGLARNCGARWVKGDAPQVKIMLAEMEADK